LTVLVEAVCGRTPPLTATARFAGDDLGAVCGRTPPLRRVAGDVR
jgi:hypothetical protein